MAGAWGGDPARKKASIAAARAALAAGPAVMCDPTLWLGEHPGEASNVYCAAYGTADAAELEARAGLPASTLVLAGAALFACQSVVTAGEENVSAFRMAADSEGPPIAALEAIRVGAYPLQLARCYVVDLLRQLAALVEPNGQGLTVEQQVLVSQLAALHESDCADPAAFRSSRRAATEATNAATGGVASTALWFAESVAWPLAGLSEELPLLVTRVHTQLRRHLRPECPTAAEQSALEALDKMHIELQKRRQTELDIDFNSERAKIATTPEYAAVYEPAFQARLKYYERLAAEAYAPFAVDLLIGAFRKA